MKNVTVTIGILSYNNDRFLSQTIESVLNQTYKGFELIIADDGSQDESLEIAESYAKKSDKIRIVTHENHVNRGISATCNLIVNSARGKYIALIGSDDAYFPYYLEEALGHLERNPEAGFVYGEIERINAKNEIIGGEPVYDITNVEDPIFFLLQDNRLSSPSVLVRKECYDKVGLFEESIVYSDWDMWIKLLTVSKIGFIDKKLIKYRYHDKNISVGVDPSVHLKNLLEFYLCQQKKIDNGCSYLNKPHYHQLVKEKIAIVPEREAIAHLDIYYFYLAQRNWSKARSHLSKAMAASPGTVLSPRRFGAIVKHFFRSLNFGAVS